MTYAVHNLHSPPVEIDDQGTMTLDGKTRIPLPSPLETFDTMEEALAWQGERKDSLG